MAEELDPRYDPRYQRGFSGPVPVAPSSGPAPEPRVQDDRPVRPISPDPVPVTRPRTTVEIPPDPIDPDTPAYAPAPLLVERPLSSNPILWALVVVGGALVVAGVVIWNGWTSLARGSAGQPVDYATLQFLIQVTPVLLGLGGATLLGVGFLLAIDRQRRSRVPVDTDGR